MLNWKLLLGLMAVFSLSVTLVSYGIYQSDTRERALAVENGLIESDDDLLSSIEALRKEVKALQDELKGIQNENGKLRYTSTDAADKNRYETNPFYVLGAYPDMTFVYDGKTHFEKPHLGLINDDDYCTKTDLYNIAHPENMFDQMNFFSDYTAAALPRKLVMDRMGQVVMPRVNFMMPDFNERKYHLDTRITNFFVNNKGIMHTHHKLGKHFACATQMYNHIPGHGNLIRKDSLLDKVVEYAQKYEDKPKCFHKNMFFPEFFRLYDEQECLDFFDMIHSQKYLRSLEKEPIQYLVKIGRGSHKGQGVYLLDKEETRNLEETYQNGTQCGLEKKSLIVQGYVSNPLLLDLDNKFDFRLYVTIASTNPLIVYYHDGFLRVSINPFDKKSEDKATHLTNTFLANQKIAEAEEKRQKINNMTKAELEEYILWTFEEFEDYLVESGKVDDRNFLENYLRPEFYKVIIHVIKMTSDTFAKHSSVYELMGLDFILDDNMQLWFIESNPSPLLTGTTQWKTYYNVLKDMFEINYAYYRSRMSRVMKIIKRFQKDQSEGKANDLEQYRTEFLEANKNRLEPEYPISELNGFRLIMDENLEGHKAYFGSIKPGCVLRD